MSSYWNNPSIAYCEQNALISLQQSLINRLNTVPQAKKYEANAIAEKVLKKSYYREQFDLGMAELKRARNDIDRLVDNYERESRVARASLNYSNSNYSAPTQTYSSNNNNTQTISKSKPIYVYEPFKPFDPIKKFKYKPWLSIFNTVKEYLRKADINIYHDEEHKILLQKILKHLEVHEFNFFKHTNFYCQYKLLADKEGNYSLLEERRESFYSSIINFLPKSSKNSLLWSEIKDFAYKALYHCEKDFSFPSEDFFAYDDERSRNNALIKMNAHSFKQIKKYVDSKPSYSHISCGIKYIEDSKKEEVASLVQTYATPFITNSTYEVFTLPQWQNIFSIVDFVLSNGGIPKTNQQIYTNILNKIKKDFIAN